MKKQWKWAIGIVVFCILAPIASTITSIGLRFHARVGGTAVVSQFLAALDTHDYTSAHALMAPAEQTAVPVTTLAEAQEQFEKKLGRWTAPAEMNEFHPDNALDDITYFYTVAFKNQDDDTDIMVRVVRTNKGWRVLEYHYDYSPA